MATMLFINKSSSKLTPKILIPLLFRNVSNKKSPPGKIIDLGSHKIHYELLGHGKHHVFLVPGLMGTGRMDWGHQLKTLNRDKFTILTWDPPAFGFSSPPDHSERIDGFYKDAEVAGKLLKALGIAKTSIVGWCGGSVHSTIIAKHNPQIVDKLVLMAPFYKFYDELLKTFEEYEDVNKWSAYLKDEIIEIHGFEFVQQQWRNWLKTFRKLEKIDDGYLCRKETESLDCPTLVIHSKNDNWVSAENGQQLSKIIKHSKFLMLDDGNHCPQIKCTEEFNKILEDFLLK
ncbi:hypothetical protein CHUAL_002024 [Chamberlinius hualienensis]